MTPFRRAFSYSSRVKNEAEVSKLKKDHLEFLEKYYTPEFIESIKTAEETIDPLKWSQRKLNHLEFAPRYLDDFTKLDPFWDYKKSPQTEFTKANQPVPKIIPPGVASLGGADDLSPRRLLLRNLSLLTGLNERYISKLQFKTLVVKMVSNQTKNGKIPTFYALVAVGDKNGMIGIGEGKDKVEVSLAIQKLHWNAVKNLTFVPRLEDRTVFGDLKYKYHSTLIHLNSAPAGFGLRVNHIIYEICELAGIKDLGGKVYRSRNQMNVAKLAFEMLTKNQRTIEELAKERGKKIVDLRKIYYSV